jgi:hypothetical protein
MTNSLSFDRDDTTLFNVHWFTGLSKAKSGLAMVRARKLAIHCLMVAHQTEDAILLFNR